MFKRNKLEEWYEGKEPEYNISECGMVNTTKLNYLTKMNELLPMLDYGNSEGESFLVDAISNIYNCNRGNVLITNGASEALFIALLALCDSSSEVTCQFPYYSEIGPFLNKMGCEIRQFDLDSNSRFSFDFERFQNVFDSSSNVAILNFPNNPTGSELSDNDYADIINYLEGTHKTVIFDEVTALPINKTYIEKNICHYLNNCICINSMSKAYGVPGIRIGWIIANEKIIKECQAIKELLSICTAQILQKIAFNILKKRDSIIENNRQIILQNIDSLTYHIDHCHMFFSINCIPQNCSCCFIKIPDAVKDYDFCLKIYKACSVLLTPGSCFGIEGYVRLGLGINPSSFNTAMDRIGAFINDYFRL